MWPETIFLLAVHQIIKKKRRYGLVPFYILSLPVGYSSRHQFWNTTGSPNYGLRLFVGYRLSCYWISHWYVTCIGSLLHLTISGGTTGIGSVTHWYGLRLFNCSSCYLNSRDTSIACMGLLSLSARNRLRNTTVSLLNCLSLFACKRLLGYQKSHALLCRMHGFGTILYSAAFGGKPGTSFGTSDSQ